MRTEGSTTPKKPEISSYLTTTEEQTTSTFEVLISNFNSAVSSSSFVTSTLSLESNGKCKSHKKGCTAKYCLLCQEVLPSKIKQAHD